MGKHFIPNWLHYFIATVWFANGLFCKVLNLVPRHQEIVTRILGNGHGRLLTVLIGVAEIGIAAWILSGIRKPLNVLIQILVVTTMNILEFVLLPDLLLWGRANSIFAFLFIILIYYNEFFINNKVTQEKACFHY